jgi:serine/threonine-protein kinase
MNLHFFGRNTIVERHPLRSAVLVTAAALLCSCSGAGGINAPATAHAGVPAGPVASGSARTQFTITIPHATQPAAIRRAQFVSPATQSMTINVTGTGSTSTPAGFPQTVNLTPTSTGCTSTLAGTQCTLNVALAPGTYDATIATSDQTNGAGNVLSAAQAVPFTVVAGASNAIALTLGGIPAAIVATPLAPGYLRGSAAGLKLYGAATQSVVVETVDADGNIITGPGSPSIALTPSSNTLLAVAGGTTAAPNVFTLRAPATGSPAVVTPGGLTLAVTATPPSSSGGSALSATIPLGIQHSLVIGMNCQISCFGASSIPDSVLVFYDGNTATPNVTLTNGIVNPQSAVVDAIGDLIVYDQNGGAGTFVEYAQGYTSASSPMRSITPPYAGNGAMAMDAAGSLYVASDYDTQLATPATGSVAIYPAGSSTASLTITDGLQGATGVAVDGNGTVYVANQSGASVTEYPAGSTTPSVTLTNGLSGLYPYGVAVDASGTVYVTANNYSTYRSSVIVYPAGSSSPSATIPVGLYSFGLAVDAAGSIFATNFGYPVSQPATVDEFARGSGASSSPSAVFSGWPVYSYPYGVTVVPGPF